MGWQVFNEDGDLQSNEIYKYESDAIAFMSHLEQEARDDGDYNSVFYIERVGRPE